MPDSPELKLPEPDVIRAKIEALEAEVRRWNSVLKFIEKDKPKPMTEVLETK